MTATKAFVILAITSLLMACASAPLLNGYHVAQITSGHLAGATYKGTWKDGYMDGQGALYFTDGSVYDGTFMSGRFVGRGTLTQADGKSTTGYWANGSFVEEKAQESEPAEKKGYCQEHPWICGMVAIGGVAIIASALSSSGGSSKTESKTEQPEPTPTAAPQPIYGTCSTLSGTCSYYGYAGQGCKCTHDVTDSDGVRRQKLEFGYF